MINNKPITRQLDRRRSFRALPKLNSMRSTRRAI
jgi:hypothetical protein